MRTALANVQTTLYPALSQGLSPSVYIDEVSESSTATEYVVIGETTMTNNSVKNRDGEEITTTIHIWNENSSYACKQLMNEVVQILTSPLSMSGGFNLWLARIEFQNVIDDPSGWKHGVLRMRMRIQN